VFFSALNKVLNDQGAFMRKRSTLKHGMMSAINRTKVALIDRLKIVPMFHHLPTSDLKKLTHQMRRKVYRKTGSVVFSYADQHDGVNDHHAVIFFVLRGSVRVTMYQDEDTDPSAAAADTRPREDFYLSKDRIFGDVGLLSGIAAACEVTTSSPNTKVLQIESRSLHQWVSQHPRVRRHMREMGTALPIDL
jgi:CRP-like cAMP-binding protein